MNMDETWNMISKGNQEQMATQIIRFHVCEKLMIAKFTDTQSILKISGD